MIFTVIAFSLIAHQWFVPELCLHCDCSQAQQSAILTDITDMTEGGDTNVKGKLISIARRNNINNLIPINYDPQ